MDKKSKIIILYLFVIIGIISMAECSKHVKLRNELKLGKGEKTIQANNLQEAQAVKFVLEDILDEVEVEDPLSDSLNNYPAKIRVKQSGRLKWEPGKGDLQTLPWLNRFTEDQV